MTSTSSTEEINILLLGQTGVGKTTFINAFANYLMHSTFEKALEGEMQVLIPALFTFTDTETFESTTITIGIPNDSEKIGGKGESCTQQCRTFVFDVGNRILRFIDAPGIGDTRGITEDEKNFRDILSFISQYQHLNGICILFKPDAQRVTLEFRFCIKELLHHLHVSATRNIMFVFTNSRSTQYRPGPVCPLLRIILKELNDKTNIDVPFSRANSFIFDNESFRCLAATKNGIKFDREHIEDYTRSWDLSIKEFGRLMSAIMKCPPHMVRDTISLNEAQQVIQKLSRPIAETARLIQENIQLAEQYRQRVLDDASFSTERIPQKEGRYVPLSHPRTVCISDTCTRIVNVNGQPEIDYASICHEDCYLAGVQKELINNPKLRTCCVMNTITGN